MTGHRRPQGPARPAGLCSADASASTAASTRERPETDAQHADARVVEGPDQGQQPGLPHGRGHPLGEVAQGLLGGQHRLARLDVAPDHHGHQPPAVQRHPERTRPQDHLGVRPGVVQDPGQQGPVGLPLQALPVPLDEAVQRERRRAPLDQHEVAGPRPAVRHQDQPPPVVPAGADHGHHPAGALVEARALGELDRPGPGLPSVQQVGGVGARRFVGEHLVREVLQHHRTSGHERGLPDDLRGLGPLDGQLGERLVDERGGAQLVDLGVDHARVHGLGDRDEPGLPVQRHQRQPASLGGPDQRGRQGRGVATAQLDHQPRRTHVVQVGHVRGQVRVVRGQRHPGGQDQLAAAQQPGDVRQLADVRPADPAVEVLLAGDDVRQALPHLLELEDVGDGGEDGGECGRGTRRGSGRSIGRGGLVRQLVSQRLADVAPCALPFPSGGTILHPADRCAVLRTGSDFVASGLLDNGIACSDRQAMPGCGSRGGGPVSGG